MAGSEADGKGSVTCLASPSQLWTTMKGRCSIWGSQTKTQAYSIPGKESRCAGLLAPSVQLVAGGDADLLHHLSQMLLKRKNLSLPHGTAHLIVPYICCGWREAENFMPSSAAYIFLKIILSVYTLNIYLNIYICTMPCRKKLSGRVIKCYLSSILGILSGFWIQVHRMSPFAFPKIVFVLFLRELYL